MNHLTTNLAGAGGYRPSTSFEMFCNTLFLRMKLKCKIILMFVFMFLITGLFGI
jgi:hypothetical protein